MDDPVTAAVLSAMTLTTFGVASVTDNNAIMFVSVVLGLVTLYAVYMSYNARFIRPPISHKNQLRRDMKILMDD